MEELTEPVTSFFSTSGFMPHGHCYLWKPALLWTHFGSDTLIGLAYVGISFLLYRLVKKIKLPFTGMFLAFGAFILFCGLTHFMAVWNLWHSSYWLSGLIKVITAIASVSTWIFLFPVGAKVAEMASAARLSEERRLKLEDANKELTALYEKIKETDNLKTQFFANVSHELRTPLSLILGPANKLSKDESMTDEQRKLATVVLRNSKTLSNQVNNLLDLSKLEAGRLKPKYTEVDLVQLLKVTVAHFETVMQGKKIFFSFQAPAETAAQVDPEKIQRVFMNLISNAVKFTPEGGRIRVALAQREDKAVVQVQDTGPGVKKEHRDIIFERFQQGEGGISREYGGSGLGLAIAKDFVDLHGGKIRLVEKNGSGAGATFEVEIPLRAPKGVMLMPRKGPKKKVDFMLEGSVEEVRALDPKTAHSPQLLGRATVLVCEDNPDMNNFIVETLAEEFNVVAASDGREGFDQALAIGPDLIVSDIMMPNMGGNVLLEKVRAHDDLHRIPVLILSARDDDEMRINLLRSGANDYVVKPFDPEELKARVKNLVSLKTTREILENALESKSDDIVGLAKELRLQTVQAQAAKEAAEEAKGQAEKANQAKGAFLTLASHELNTPITTLYLNIEMLNDLGVDISEEKKREMLERALMSTRYVKDLVESLLEYTRIESGELVVNSKQVDLERMIEEVSEVMSPLAKKKGVDYRVTGFENAQALSDERLLRVALNNLISNAIKFTEAGYVEARFEQVDGQGVISVKDTGPGISEIDQSRVFNPFEQLEPLAKKNLRGVGLGLSLVKEVVKAIGARVELVSSPGKGSEFQIYLGSDRDNKPS